MPWRNRLKQQSFQEMVQFSRAAYLIFEISDILCQEKIDEMQDRFFISLTIRATRRRGGIKIHHLSKKREF